MLAESYAIAGDVKRAAVLLRTVDTSAGQIDARVFWYEHIGEPRARGMAEAGGKRERIFAQITRIVVERDFGATPMKLFKSTPKPKTPPFVTVVSGLPRSGTSMMMKST